MSAFDSRILGLSLQDTDLDTLDTACHSFPDVRARALDFAVLSLPGLLMIDKGMIDARNQLDRRCKWKILNQNALQSLIHFLNQENQRSSGEGKYQLDQSTVHEFQSYCGLKFPSTYTWDLTLFMPCSFEREVKNGPRSQSSSPKYSSTHEIFWETADCYFLVTNYRIRGCHVLML
ncbi:uncharacterized protein ATNIH1004_004064 [Aspergillus tanneri]|uniref:Uncharacterized protein n=1 Tax=Aspergillus tanneri TaxID=1220188 RepID=A0A5M9MMD5_9EURO|nr:uncharacterized protein ATNIH1004_004064 [Aspergillus tanneri]KAA8648181.1 hypothetical protein ATNIH1004_004064 [Aspergillus tanneri]